LTRALRSSRAAFIGAALALAACAGAAPEPGATPQGAPPAASSPFVPLPPSGDAEAPAAVVPPPAATGPALAPPTEIAPPAAEPPAPSAFAADLAALGLDVQNLPPMDKLEPRALRGVMRLFARSLGVKCADCHEPEGSGAASAGARSFAMPTRRKKIATHMWNEFLVKLAAADGSPLFCDSCHEGRVRYLDRRDKKALASWMDAHFVAKLTRKDGKDHGCETCHVNMNMTFLAEWGR
jgi:hypothetical protein